MAQGSPSRPFEGRVALITGAASGLGRAFADRFGQAGCRLVLADVEEVALATAVDELTAAGVEAWGVPADVSDAASMDALGEAVLARHGAVDLLINNAGVGLSRPIEMMSTQDWQWVLGVNLWGVIHGLRVFLPHMRARNAGHVVNVASVAGHVCYQDLAAYNASKHAVVAISETLRAELLAAGSSIAVTVLCPGMVRTRITTSARNRPEALQNPGAVPAPQPPLDEATVARRQAALEAMFGAAKPPEFAAEVLYDAVAARRFYVWTDDSFAAEVQRRYEELKDALDAVRPAAR